MITTTSEAHPSGAAPAAYFAVAPSPLSPRFGAAGGTGARARGQSLSSGAGAGQLPPLGSRPRPGSGGGGKRSMPPHTSESPAKKQSKWSPEEDALIIELRGSGMKWDDISKRLPGRSSISCRLHYQNYLERRSEWDEERKNKLARLYERFKPEMWAKVAEEMQVPWRAAEAMHWQLGESDMARRAGVVPFSLNMTTNEPQGGPYLPQQFQQPPHHHHYQQPPPTTNLPQHPAHHPPTPTNTTRSAPVQPQTRTSPSATTPTPNPRVPSHGISPCPRRATRQSQAAAQACLTPAATAHSDSSPQGIDASEAVFLPSRATTGRVSRRC
ncbi:hypothetical protein N0V88_000513 [Collariella sp. IMI 366227]|nr:hypothetical protein N0V88_000513 [Collariella sp. IMI 366227]